VERSPLAKTDQPKEGREVVKLQIMMGQVRL
jgi:hypothetical protein